MATDLYDIRTAILTKLGTISQLHAVYGYEIDKPLSGKYPYATVTWIGGDGEFGDTQRNLRVHKFAIRVYQERTQPAFGNSKAEDLVLQICDAIYTAFDNDTRLGGTVKFVEPLEAVADYVDKEFGDVRFVELVAKCHTVVDSIT